MTLRPNSSASQVRVLKLNLENHMTERGYLGDEAAPDYKNSRPFDVHRWSEHPELRLVTEDILREIAAGIPARADWDDHRKHLRVILLDLYHRYLQDPSGWIGLSLNRNSYSGANRYNKLFLSYRPVARLIRLLKEHGFIEFVSGFHDRRNGVGYTSRIRAEKKLRALFEDMRNRVAFGPFNEQIAEEKTRELIILRDHEHHDVDYEENDQTRAMRRQLLLYNEFMRNKYLDVSLRGWPWAESIDLTRKQLHRVFNNGSWEQGGRYYGAWWQNVNRDLRQRIQIGDKKTIEIDYSGLHIVLLYAMAGIDYFADVGEDPYLNPRIVAPEVADRAGSAEVRSLMKTLSLAAINADNELKAIQAVNSETDRAIRGRLGIPMWELLRRFAEFHAPIRPHFCSGIGIRLQYIDSLITENVIDWMVLREGVPVLPVHDSYVCSVRDDGLLRNTVSIALDHVLHSRGWKRVAAKTKELVGELYKNPDIGLDEDGFVNDDIDVLFNNLDHELEGRANRWRETGQQSIVNYEPSLS